MGTATWLRRCRPGLSPTVADGALAALIAVVQVSYLWAVPPDHLALLDFEGPSVIAVLLALTGSLPLVARRRAPSLVLAVVGLSAVALALLQAPGPGFGLVVALYSVAVYAPRPESLTALAIFALLTAVSLVLVDAVQYAAANVLIFVTAWILGDQRRAGHARVVAVEAQAAQLERERDERARLAMMREQAHIGAEIQDLVAHRLAAMLAQARGAERFLEQDPQRAEDALRAVADSGRESLTELRRLVALLRGVDDGELAPRPGAADLDPDAAAGRAAVRIAPRRRGSRRRLRGPCPPPLGGPSVSRIDAVFARARALPILVQDALLAAAVVVADLFLLLWHDPPGLEAGQADTLVPGVPVLLLLTAPLVVRRRAPHLVMLATIAGAVVATGMEVPTQLLAPLVALYTVAAHRPRRDGLVWLGVSLAVAVALLASLAELQLLPGQVVILVTAWLLGDRQQAFRARDEALRARADELQRARELADVLAASEERARIARELHDILAHSISLMVVQATAALRVLPVDRQRARGAVEQVVAGGRSSLDELRGTVGLFDDGTGEQGPASFEPQPCLEDVSALADSFREAGICVSLDVGGPARPLPAAVELSAWRIVQEALTNVMKHAGAGAAVEVRLRYGDRELAIDVTDDGAGATSPNSEAGHGLIGLRERAWLHGGALEAGSRPAGGFGVSATLPLEELT